MEEQKLSILKKKKEEAQYKIISIYENCDRLYSNQIVVDYVAKLLKRTGYIDDVEFFATPSKPVYGDFVQKYEPLLKQEDLQLQISVENKELLDKILRVLEYSILYYEKCPTLFRLSQTLGNGEVFFKSRMVGKKFAPYTKETLVEDKIIPNKAYMTNFEQIRMLYDALVDQNIIDSNFETEAAFFMLVALESNSIRRKKYEQYLEKYKIENEIDENFIINLINQNISDKEIYEIVSLSHVYNNPNLRYLEVLDNVENEIDIIKGKLKKKKFLESLDNPQNEMKITLADIDVMSGTEFENFVADLFEKMGYKTFVTKASNDQGIDVVATKNAVRVAIQAKCYSGVVSNHSVMEAVAGMKFYSADKCMVVTNSSFTKSARELARKNNVELWDRETLQEKIDEVM